MANTACLFLNNYQTTLGAALPSTSLTMTVSSVVGLPASLTTGQFIPMTLTPASSPGSVYEIVYVTGISGANLTIERGMENNTSALNWSTGDILYSTNTADTTAPLAGPNFTGPVSSAGLITANGGIAVPGGQTLDVAGNTTTGEITASGVITANGGIDLALGQPVTGIPYDIASGVSGPIGASQYVAYFLSPRSINIPANFSGSLASVLTSFTSAATFTIYHNGTSVGTISFAAGGTTGTFSTGSGFTLNPGDSLTIQAPSTADATAANLSIIIDAVLA